MGYYVTIENISKDYKRMWDYICKKKFKSYKNSSSDKETR